MRFVQRLVFGDVKRQLLLNVDRKSYAIYQTVISNDIE